MPRAISISQILSTISIFTSKFGLAVLLDIFVGMPEA
jgi:hypothetical protein